ncbi:MAG TPA: hypothetical protein K8V54_08295 [Corynebacterium kroppenstedtii]|nr:hypothetical protein [Corynebacterium kroppenstedtii]
MPQTNAAHAPTTRATDFHLIDADRCEKLARGFDERGPVARILLNQGTNRV